MLRTRRVRLYLSSLRLGPQGHRLLPLPGTGVAPRSFAMPSTGSRTLTVSVGLRCDVEELASVELDVELVDLRVPAVGADLSGFDLVWVRVARCRAVPRRVLADSGADEALVTLLQRDQVVCGGCSAGACVLGPDLTELGHVDESSVVVEPITPRSPSPRRGHRLAESRQ